MDETWSPDRDQWSKASSPKPPDTWIRAQAWAAKRQAASFKLDKPQALGYYKIMNKKQKQIIKEWRKIRNKLIFIKNKNANKRS